MNLNLLVSILSATYVGYYIVVKLLLKYFTLKEIIVHAYLISAIIVLIFFKNDLLTSIKKININYFYLILLAIIMVLSNAYGIIGCDSNINFGVIDSLSNSIYLPLVALISFYFFNAKISYINFTGIVIVAIGAYLVNY